MTAETRATRSSTGKMRSLVLAACRRSPLTQVSMSTPLGSMSVAMHGPTGQKLSKALARVGWPSRAWRSRAVTSLRQV